MASAPLNVLFVCKGNSSRSIMAEAIMTKLAAGKFKAYSAGSNPRPEVNPYAARLLASLKLDVSALRPKDWNQFAKPDSPELDFVFTLSETAANEPAPAWHGNPMTARWVLPDPAAFAGEDVQKALAFADAYRMLNNRISIFASLPLAALEKMALQHRLDAIGKDMGRKDMGRKEDAA